MPPRVVIAYAPLEEAKIEMGVFREAGIEVASVDSFDSPEARELLRTAEGLMVKLQRVPASLLAEMERCRIVTRVGTGYDTIDTEAAARHGIWVTNVPDYSIDEVSSHALALLLTGGGPAGATETIVIRIYNTAFRFYDFSYAAVLGVAGFVMALTVALVFLAAQRRLEMEAA